MLAGTRINHRYEIREAIGEGAMGEVFQGIDQETGEAIAVKALKAKASTPELIERFRREGEALGQLNHPNIVKVLDTLEEDARHYIIMEYVDGGSLGDVLQHGAQLPVDQVLRIALELADALTRAHLLNIVHRDIKPANILLTADQRPKLTDWGIAHVGDSPRLTGTGTMFGTIDYLSPEAVQGEKLDHRTDIWSFGVTLYEMLASQLPFRGDNFAAILTAIVGNPVPEIRDVRADIPDDLMALIERMLVKDRDARIGSVRQVGADLEAIMRGEIPTSPGTITQTVADKKLRTSSIDIELRTDNLPAQSTPFVGRENELEEIAGLVRDPKTRLVTLLGPGGIGKTRLSLAAAAAQIGVFRDGVFFVGLAPLLHPDFIVSAIADAVDYEFYGSDEPRDQLLAFLREKELLLVMDNFEHLLAGADLIAEILATAPDVTVTATSRERLNLSGEWIFNVEGMLFPDYLTPEELETYGAIQLFIQSAARAQSGFAINDANKDAITQICQRVYGVPLAIELAAAWVEMLSLDEIIAEIDKSLDFLESDLRDVPERHRSIRAVFDYSWNLMSDAERAVFTRIAVFHGGFTREAAQEVANASLRDLSTLVNKSLLRRLPSGRYEVHELLRQYAEAALTESEKSSVTNRHSAYYLNLLQQHEEAVFGNHFGEAMQHIDSELENLRCALAWGLEFGHADPLEEILQTLYLYYESRGLTREGIEVYGLIAEAFRHDPDRQLLYAKAIIRQGTLMIRTDQYERAVNLLEEGIALAEKLDKPIEKGWGLVWLSYTRMAVGQYDEAKRIGQEALDLLVPSGFLPYIGAASAHLGYAHFLSGEFDRARKLTEDAREIVSSQQDLFALGFILNNLGEVLRVQGDLDGARTLFKDASKFFRDIGYKRGLAFSINNLGGVLQVTGEYEEAAHLFRKGYELNKQIADRIGIGHSLSALGNIAGLDGKPDEARTYFEQSLALRRDINDPRGVADSLVDLARMEIFEQDFVAAREFAEESLSIRRDIGDQQGIGEGLALMAELALWEGDYHSARDLFDESSTLIEDLTNPMSAGWVICNTSMADVELGNHQAAIDRLQSLLDRMGDQQGFEWAVAWGFCIVAFAHLGLGQVDEARKIALRSLQVGADTEHPLTLPFAIITLAYVLHHEGNLKDAVRLLASIRANDNRVKFFSAFAMTRIKSDDLWSKLQAAMSAEDFAAAQDGGDMAAQDGGDMAAQDGGDMAALAHEFLAQAATA